MKNKQKIIVFVIALLFVGGFNSCSKTYDNRLDRLEESIESLNQNYKNYSPKQLKREIEKCENLLDKLQQDESKLSIAQRKQLNKLKRKETRVLLKISIHLKLQGTSSEITDLIQYIKDILMDRANLLKDSTDSLDSLDSLDFQDSNEQLENSL